MGTTYKNTVWITPPDSGDAGAMVQGQLDRLLARGGGILSFGKGRYTLGGTRALNYQSGVDAVDVRLEFEEGCVFDLAGNTAGNGIAALTFNGFYVIDWLQTAGGGTLAAGSRTMTVPSDVAAQIRGDGRDVIITAAWNPDPSVVYNHNAETMEVESVSGTTVTFKERTRADQPSGHRYTLYRGPRVNVAGGLRIERDDPDAGGLCRSGVTLFYCTDATLEGLECNGCWYSAYQYVYVANCYARGLRADNRGWNPDVENFGNLAMSYGLAMGPCRQGYAEGCTLLGAKHAGTTTGNAKAQNITFHKCRFSSYGLIAGSKAPPAVWQHASGDGFTLQDCEVDGGICFVGKNGRVLHCDKLSGRSTATGDFVPAILCAPQRPDCEFWEFIGNTIEGDAVGGIVLGTGWDDLTWQRVNVAENFIRLTNASYGISVRQYYDGQLTVHDLRIRDTHVLMVGGGPGLDIQDGAGEVLIDRLKVDGTYGSKSVELNTPPANAGGDFSDSDIGD